MKLRYTLRGAAELDRVLTDLAEIAAGGAPCAHAHSGDYRPRLRYPYAGQLASKGRLRRQVTYPYPHLIFYQATDDEIVIHALRHSARNPSSMPGSG